MCCMGRAGTPEMATLEDKHMNTMTKNAGTPASPAKNSAKIEAKSPARSQDFTGSATPAKSAKRKKHAELQLQSHLS